MLFPADDDLLVRAADLNHVERRARGHAQSLALAHGEVVNAAVLADDFAICRDEIAGSIRQRLALLGEISIDKPLVVTAGDETDFLRVRLLCERKAMLAGKLADRRRPHFCYRNT